jgi:hypothetical protein
VATALSVGVIATIMILGIRTKLPPPDPAWREHLPLPEPPLTRLQLVVFVGFRFGLFVAALVAALFHANRLAFAFMVGYLALLMAWVVVRVRAARRARQEQQGHHQGGSVIG